MRVAVARSFLLALAALGTTIAIVANTGSAVAAGIAPRAAVRAGGTLAAGHRDQDRDR
jgi:hypothetical protein